MHFSCTGWFFVLCPATALEQGLVWRAAFAVALWVMVVTVVTVWGFVAAMRWWRTPLRRPGLDPQLDPLPVPVAPPAGAGKRGL